MAEGLDYRSAGVDLDRAERDKAGMKGLLASTRDGNTLSELGSFGGLYAVPPDVKDPVLVSSADGVGTKLKVAFRTGVHDTVGRDLVNHCVNDILVQGARPLFFLDYLATGHVEDGVVEAVVRGVAEGCRENGCVLLGGETAQMPDFYGEGEYDLAGFIVGIVSRDRILDGSRVQAGDTLIGLPSSGLHTNGYTLARKILLDVTGLGAHDRIPGLDQDVAGALLEVHRSYLGLLEPELTQRTVRALAHITGGGLSGNLPRSLPEGLGAEVQRDSWDPPPIFHALQKLGSVQDAEMFRVFNMGVGMVVVVAPEDEDLTLSRIREREPGAWVMGRVTETSGVELV